MSPKGEKQKLVKTDANKGRRRKGKKTPPKELKEWTIRRQPTVQRRAEIGDEQTAADDELNALEKQIEDSYDAHKKLKKRVEGEIEEVRERLRELATENKHGVVATQLCHRARVDGDWVYTDATTGEVLYREPAADGKQLSLDDAKEKAQAEKTATGWPWCEPSWHPFVRERQAEAQEAIDQQRARAQALWPLAKSHTEGWQSHVPSEWQSEPSVREAWPVHSQLWFRELVEGDPSQLISTCGGYQVRKEYALKPPEYWVALHGQDTLWTRAPSGAQAEAHRTAGAATWRCVEHDENLAEQRERAAEARATHEERTEKMKWRKSRGSPTWTAGEHLVSAAKPGKLELRYAMFELGEVHIAGEFPTRAELRAAQVECERLAHGKKWELAEQRCP